MYEDLICPAKDIFDRAAVDAEIAKAAEEASGDLPALRSKTLKILMDAQKAGRAMIAERFGASPFQARPTIHAYTYLTDSLVHAVLKYATHYAHPLPTPTSGERLAVLAVGGYGRGDMAPFSDVDLLFLTPYKITPWAESVIESMLYLLWDLRLKVGHASRTISDCIKLGREDFTIRTALLEQRYLDGDEELAKDLRKRLRNDLFKGTEREFITAKLEERDLRHEKQGGQRYVVEPNVKEGKGGLRDLQSVFWIAKYVHGVNDAADLVPLGVFTKDEFQRLEKAEDFIWATRCHLHLATNRPTEQLTFDLQVEVASRMGYADGGGRRAVEHFLQDYFRHATSVGDLTRIFLTALEATHTKAGPSLATFFRRRKKLRDNYIEINNRLGIKDEKLFLSAPVNFLHLFDEALRTGLLIHPNAMRLVVANLHLIDDELRNSKEANKIFLDLLLKRGNPERALRRMNELGVLAAFMPEFAPIVAMMQFNMYHSYTVDEHTIQCISQMAQIERQELTEPLPLASSIFDEGINRKVLYVAMLLHDIGKGRKEDHSILGAQISRKITPRLGLKREECETVEWLVRYHLLMSDMAQKRDISDPRTVRAFAKAVKTRKRLDLLTVLTVCDIRGVGPNTWNNWKAMLLRQLHAETAKALEHGLEEVNRESRGNEAKSALRASLKDWTESALREETKRHYPPYWQGLPQQTHVIFANLLKNLDDDEIRIDLHPDPDRDATRACFAMQDHPGIFARLAGALALVGANVVDARTYTSKDGYATAVFWVQDAEGHPYEESRLARLRTMILKILKGEVLAGQALKDKDKFKKREKAFRVPTSITFDNDGSEIYTIIEVDTRDRPGLLYDLARTLSNNNIYISSAVIATYGEQVVDTFYVKDMFGLKFYSQSKREALEKRLREAIDKGVERAIA